MADLRRKYVIRMLQTKTPKIHDLAFPSHNFEKASALNLALERYFRWLCKPNNSQVINDTTNTQLISVEREIQPVKITTKDEEKSAKRTL